MREPTTGFVIRGALEADLETVARLLADAELPREGLSDQFPDAYAVATVAGQIVGAAAIEGYEESGLLRSVVVSEAFRGKGIAEALVRELLARARLSGMTRVFALTTTAAAYFTRLGFTPVDRATAPAALRASPQLVSVCPSTATFLAFPI